MNTLALKVAIALNNIQSDEVGQGIAEYAILTGVVAVAALAGMTLFGAQLDAAYQDLACNLPGANCAP